MKRHDLKRQNNFESATISKQLNDRSSEFTEMNIIAIAV